MRPATTSELARWDELVVANPDGGQILQSRTWGEFKRAHGWTPRHLVHDDGGRPIAVLILARRIPGLGELCYSPKGPGVSTTEQLVEVLRGGLGQPAPFALKVEPEIPTAEVDPPRWAAAGLVKAPRDVQISRATIVVDLRPDEEALLRSFKSKTRYNIRLAARKGVTVQRMPVDGTTTGIMFRLMAATQARAGFTLRPRQYFEGYWNLQHASGQGELFFASRAGEVLAGVFVTRLGRRAWYKDGGSTKRHAELMAPHLLQWEVMRWLRSEGVEWYDLVAVPRPSELSPEHPLFGLHRFKSGFSEEVREFAGTWDLPLDRRRYAIWTRYAERAAHQWSLRVRRDLFY